MKKIVFFLAVFLLAGGSVFAQKKNVSKAKLKLTAEVPDLNAAKEAILLALDDSTTNKQANTWFVAAEVFNAIYAEKKLDKNQVAQISSAAIRYYVKADSLDQLPDAKGKIKPKFHTKIVEKVKGLQRSYLESGFYYNEIKDYAKAMNSFDGYLNYKNIPAMKDLGLEKDTLIPLITYYAALSAIQANLLQESTKYLEAVKDNNKFKAEEQKWMYQQLSQIYSTNKDTVNMLRLYQNGVQRFPEEAYFVKNLINFYINQENLTEALTWIDQAIKQDTTSAVLLNLKGRITEEKDKNGAIVLYKKAVSLDPSFSDALGNLGRIYYNDAVEELARVNNIRDDKKYKTEKAKLKAKFELPLPYFEKAYSVNPNERDFVIALRGIYYNLGMEAKYKEMEARLNDM
jgi:hypothetical protein